MQNPDVAWKLRMEAAQLASCSAVRVPAAPLNNVWVDVPLGPFLYR